MNGESCENGECSGTEESCGCSKCQCGCESECGCGCNGEMSAQSAHMQMFMQIKKKAMVELISDRVKRRLEQSQKEKLDKIADILVEMAAEHMRIKKEMSKKYELKEQLMDILSQ